MTDKPSFHEGFGHEGPVQSGSEKAFGLVFATVFAIIAVWPLLTQSDQQGALRLWALFVAGTFAITALTVPKLLRPLNRVWFLFGLVLHKVVNPLVMGLLFFLTVTPLGLLMRSLGKRPLDLDFDKQTKSYWILRTPPGPAPETMKKQF
jgi:predicted membrane metal-binding protein